MKPWTCRTCDKLTTGEGLLCLKCRREKPAAPEAPAKPKSKHTGRPKTGEISHHTDRLGDDPVMREYLALPVLDGVIPERHRKRAAELARIIRLRQFAPRAM